ncbi:MAG: SIMPL domain-containing protein [Pseudomonadales bacterium]
MKMLAPLRNRMWLLLATLLTVPIAAPMAAQPDSGIQVTGSGEVQVVPDMARVSLQVRREGQDAAALKHTLDEVAARVLALADELAIPRREVTAAAVNIYPRYRQRNDTQTVDGIIAVRTIEVTLRDLALLGDLINGALERGVNGVGGVQLDAQNRVELERRALDLAIDDAIREARQIAKRFEVTLGALAHARTGRHTVRPMMMESMAVRSAADSFEPGEMTIRRDVEATFGIQP